jgi:hypothetical protein
MTKKTDLNAFYRRIIPQAWKIAWEHKHLWLLGFFATTVGFGGVFEMLSNIYDHLTNVMPSQSWLQWPYFLLPGGGTFKAVMTFSPNPALTLALMLLAMALAAAIMIWLAATSLGAVIGSVERINEGGDADFSQGTGFGVASFWRLAGINLLAKTIIGAMAVLTGINLFVLIADNHVFSGFFYWTSFIIFTIFAATVSVVAVYASNAAVIQDLKFREALEAGWKAFRRHWLASLEIAFMLMVINLGVSAIFVIIGALLATPLFFLFFLASVAGLDLFVTLMSAFTVAFLLFGIMIAVSFATTFQIAAWTLAWKELGGGKHRSIVIRLFEKLQRRK